MVAITLPQVNGHSVTQTCVFCACVCVVYFVHVCVPPFTLHLLTPPLFLHVSCVHNGLLLSVQGSCESDHPGGHASFSHRWPGQLDDPCESLRYKELDVHLRRGAFLFFVGLFSLSVPQSLTFCLLLCASLLPVCSSILAYFVHVSLSLTQCFALDYLSVKYLCSPYSVYQHPRHREI